MHLKDLAYFESLAVHKNYTLVAEQFKVTQPTITYAIKRLEQEVGATLFTRNQAHKEVNLTEAGAILLQSARHIQVEWATATKEIQRLNVNKIRLGLPPIIETYFFPRVAKQLLKANVLHLIETEEVGSSKLLTLLRQGNIDIALIGATENFDLTDLEVVELASFPFVIIAKASDPRKFSYFADFANDDFISLDEQFVHPKAFKALSNQSGTQPHVIYQTNNVTAMKNLVREGIGLAFLTALAVQKNEDGLKKINLIDQPQPNFHVYMAFRKQHYMTQNQIKVSDIIKGAFQ
ncbi:LysR family transcriptional regulator [Weissella bombi]|uniref:LysR family transcriptional regulator n=1 Tax=Weissella bombi TaxID=1505725 RepID=UPI003AF280B6